MKTNEENDMDYVIFGAGKRGRAAYKILKKRGERVEAFIDNNEVLWNRECIDGVEIISLQDYFKRNLTGKILIAVAQNKKPDIIQQLEENGVYDFNSIEREDFFEKGRLITYCSQNEMEDIILYYALEEDDDIFYIDVGSNDPCSGSVTKMLYDCKLAHGINIDPLPACINITEMERKRDINICKGVGKKQGKKLLYLQEGGSTMHEENVFLNNTKALEVEIVTLKSICENYIDNGRSISFLKIDVEGAEKDVLLGADFEKYRPKIVVIYGNTHMAHPHDSVSYETNL